MASYPEKGDPSTPPGDLIVCFVLGQSIGSLYDDPVTWHGINYAGTQIMQWGF